MTKENVKISEVVGLLEKLSIKNYAIFNHLYAPLDGPNKIIEFEKIADYYKVVKKLKSKSWIADYYEVAKKFNSKRILMQKRSSLIYLLASNHKGCLFETTIDVTNSKTEPLINKLKKENLLTE
ncbi:hypothetical protein HYT91_03545 [Candidatus Pacearchaeota archaeon]|nr:hypothetical protein [Candidatus Pacearchaeota archaeon]